MSDRDFAAAAQSPLDQTPSQTVGPFFHDALLEHGVSDLDPSGIAGEPIEVEGSVRDGSGAAVADAMLEIWQSDGNGRYRHPADGRSPDVPTDFIGFGRIGTNDDGVFRFSTVMPGTVPYAGDGVQAPHLNVHVFARGLLDRLMTRIYFEDQDANSKDPVLARVPEDRRSTLLARRVKKGHNEATRYRFDIVLQGNDETVFFDA